MQKIVSLVLISFFVLILLLFGCVQTGIINCGNDLKCMEKNRGTCTPSIADPIVVNSQFYSNTSYAKIIGMEGNCCKVEYGVAFHDSNNLKQLTDANCIFITYWKGEENVVKNELIYDQYKNCSKVGEKMFIISNETC